MPKRPCQTRRPTIKTIDHQRRKSFQAFTFKSKTFVALLQHQEFKTYFLRKLQSFYLSAVAFQQLLLIPSDESAVQEHRTFRSIPKHSAKYCTINNFLQLQIVLNAKYVAKVKQFASAIHRSSHHRSTEGTAEIVDFLFRCIPLVHNQDATPLRGVIDLTKVRQAHNKQTKLKQAKSNERTQSHRVQPYSVLVCAENKNLLLLKNMVRNSLARMQSVW